jgi:nicotinamide mononucleotide (NMN) deamidase PncC
VGTVHLGLDRGGADPVVQSLSLPGERDAIRRETVAAGLRLLLSAL